ncbi:MAG TPA: ABC transporter permease, partial [Thermotoga sp.]|nr:ABC transporter permease [Thermotoga sp.]
MLKYIGKRSLQIVVLLFIYVTIVYWLLEAMPGSFASQYVMNPKLTPEIREKIKQQFGLDKPPFIRYLYYMKNFLKLDLGTSFLYYPKKVTDIIKERLPRTLFLFMTATLVSYSVGYNLGKRIAWKRGKFSDKAATFVGIVFWTIFTPLLAIFNIWLFAVILKLLPLNQFIDPNLWRTAPIDSNTVFLKLLFTGFCILLALIIALIVASFQKTLIAKKSTVFGTLIATIIIAIVFWSRSEIGIYGLDIIKH